MNSQEGLTLAKMAIVVLLVCLVISAALGMWYMMSDKEAAFTKSVVNSAKSGNYDRIFDMSMNCSNGETYPIPTVINCLDELEDDELVYVLCQTYPDFSNTAVTSYSLFHYKDVIMDISAFEANLGINNVTTVEDQFMVDKAIRFLSHHSSNDCVVTIQSHSTGYGDVYGVFIQEVLN